MFPIAAVLPYWKIAAIVVAVIIAFGAGFAVNGWRMGVQLEQCNTRVGALTDQVAILGDKIGTQNEAITAAGEGGRAAAEAGAKLLAEAKRLNAANAGALARLEQQLAQAVPKRQDGKDKDCGDARKEIRAIKGGKP